MDDKEFDEIDAMSEVMNPTPEEEQELWDAFNKYDYEHCKKQVVGFKKILHFLADDYSGDVRSIIEALANVDEFEVLDDVEGTLKIVNNKLYIEANVPNIRGYGKEETIKYTFEWQHADNCACWQGTDYEDSYYGYLLFPYYGFKKFMCIYYNC